MGIGIYSGVERGARKVRELSVRVIISVAVMIALV